MSDNEINVLKLALQDIRKAVPKYTPQEMLSPLKSEEQDRLMQVDKILNIMAILDFITGKGHE